ncbi:chaperone modulator CbpM [Halotalea alkalilenta]|uniref:chaperone modulator CbpM n=1 Tax=Halotalea alkalilenta TaxID=376489 RepID=UPI000480F216|nr:chaperone modulator CbpM [Halotalea alkalilenta]
MSAITVNTFDFDELCSHAGVTGDIVVTIVEHGILAPSGHEPRQWRFDVNAVLVVKRVVRLRRDLDLDWQGAALALELFDENQRLRAENAYLRRRLERFIDV